MFRLRPSRRTRGRILVSALLVALAIPSAASSKEKSTYNLARMEAFSWVLLQLKDDYVDPSRVRPAAMMKAALENIERRASEVEIKLRNGRADVQVGSERRAFEVGNPATVWEMNYNLQPIFEFVAEHLEATSDPKQVEFAAINGLLTTLDPHSNLLPPELFREMQLKTTGEFGGLGIRITIRKGALTVISPLPDTPAARMGLRAMDTIVRIEDQSTENMPLDEAVNYLRGPPNTKVTIWVMRKGWSEPHKYVITRDTIRVRSVISKLLGDGIGYIQIQDFGRHTAGDLIRHLRDLKRQAKGLRGLVLDLRNNAGGLMKAAVAVADMFLDRGIIVATVAYSEDSSPEKRVQKSREEQRAKEDGVDSNLPMVVLVNGGSASASEILAGALKNLDRTILMGEQSFGKGTVQILNERVPVSVEGACLKLTVAEYLIPGDISIQEIGVTPDIQLVRVILEKDSVQAFAQRDRFREADIPKHLKTHKAFELKPAETVRYVFEEDREQLGEDEEPPLQEPGFKEDFEIKLARQYLLKVKSAKGSDMLDKGASFLAQVKKEEQEKIGKKMSGLGIDWSSGTGEGARADVQFEITGEGADAEGRARADLKVNLKLSVRNTGTKPFFRLRAESESKHSLFDNREFLFGRINPGESRDWEVPIKIPRNALTRTDDVRFKFACEGGRQPPPVEATINTVEIDRPSFGFSWRARDVKGNGDGLIQAGERIELQVSVHNLGRGKAYRTRALLKNEAGKDLFLEAGKGRVELGEIQVGESKTKAFVFRVREDTKQETLPVEMTIWDADLGTTQTSKIHLPLARSSGDKPAPGVTGLEVRRHRTAIRGGAAVEAPVVSFTKKASILLSDRRLGKWYHLKGKQGSLGWIHADSVKRVAARNARPARQDNLLPFVQVTPPVIELDPAPSYVKQGDTLRLKARIEDKDAELRDVAVWVADDKVYLSSGATADNPHAMTLDVPVKLDPGPNYITLVAREGARFSSQKTLVITRPGGLDWKEDDKLVAEEQGSTLIME